MSKEPLYPHVPKKKEPLYPHQARWAEAEIDQIIADLNLLREEKVWIDTFKTTGASVIHIQTGDTATITSPPEDFISPNYADRAMQIKWADGSEMVVDSNDFAPSSLQKQIAEITHGKPIPEFPSEKSPREIWDSAKLGIKVELTKSGGWVNDKGQLTRLGERIAESKWNDLSPAAQNVLQRLIYERYQAGYP